MKTSSLAILAILAVFLFGGAATLINLSTQVTGVLPYANGGTGLNTPGSSGNILTSTGSGWSSSSPSCCSGGSGTGFAWGGSGADGAITADGTTTIPCLGAPGTHNGISSSYLMVEDCNATTFTVNSGVTVIPQQTRIFATTSITVNGTIRASATAGGNGGAGAASGTAGTAGTTPVPDGTLNAYATAPVGCLWGSSANCSNNAGGDPYSAGKAGGTGSATANGGAGTVGSAATTPAASICASTSGVAGVNGGAGGQSGGGVHSGGNLGSGTAAPACTVSNLSEVPLTLPGALTWNAQVGSGTLDTIGYIPGTAESGSGGAGGGDGTVAGGGGGGSGATGGPGNQIILSSPTITIGASGILNADGSNGGNGGNGGTPASGNAGGGGGGGAGSGGNGGVIVLVYHSYTNGGSVHANGGSGGTKGTHGSAAGTGTNGNDGSNGNNGISGLVLQIPQ